jgi:hypothetical protein
MIEDIRYKEGCRTGDRNDKDVIPDLIRDLDGVRDSLQFVQDPGLRRDDGNVCKLAFKCDNSFRNGHFRPRPPPRP